MKFDALLCFFVWEIVMEKVRDEYVCSFVFLLKNVD